jgi:DNA-binding NarL/FixJ family response regulator
MLIVDDHAVVRRGARELLAESFVDVDIAEAATGEQAIDLVGDTPVDLVILDLSLPGMGGLATLRELRAAHPRMPVLILSAHSEDQYALRALKSGAAGYVTKDLALEELVAAARAVLAGERYIGKTLPEEGRPPPHAALSEREFQVLRLLALGRSVKDIGGELDLSEKTISTYRARILAKMEMHSNAELMRYALRAGLVE